MKAPHFADFTDPTRWRVMTCVMSNGTSFLEVQTSSWRFQLPSCRLYRTCSTCNARHCISYVPYLQFWNPVPRIAARKICNVTTISFRCIRMAITVIVLWLISLDRVFAWFLARKAPPFGRAASSSWEAQLHRSIVTSLLITNCLLPLLAPVFYFRLSSIMIK